MNRISKSIIIKGLSNNVTKDLISRTLAEYGSIKAGNHWSFLSAYFITFLKITLHIIVFMIFSRNIKLQWCIQNIYSGGRIRRSWFSACRCGRVAPNCEFLLLISTCTLNIFYPGRIYFIRRCGYLGESGWSTITEKCHQKHMNLKMRPDMSARCCTVIAIWVGPVWTFFTFIKSIIS
jgi:hypothetical protein